jgi:septal ring factor EnvC (AmiA/AmiB activator)
MSSSMASGSGGIRAPILMPMMQKAARKIKMLEQKCLSLEGRLDDHINIIAKQDELIRVQSRELVELNNNVHDIITKQQEMIDSLKKQLDEHQKQLDEHQKRLDEHQRQGSGEETDLFPDDEAGEETDLFPDDDAGEETDLFADDE